MRSWDFSEGLRLCTPNAGALGSIPGQVTRYHMPQLKILHARTKTWLSQINIKKKITVLALPRASMESDNISLHSISSFKKSVKWYCRGSDKWLAIVLLQSKPGNKKAVLASIGQWCWPPTPKYFDLFPLNCSFWRLSLTCFLGHHNLFFTSQFFCPFSTFLSGFPTPPAP